MADRELAAGLLRVDRRLAGIEHRLGLRLQAAGYPALAAAGGAPLPPSAADPAGSEGAAVSPKKSIPWYADFLGGVVGGTAGIVIGYPPDTVKLRLQAPAATDGPAVTTRQVVLGILRKEGALGFFRGMASPLLAAVPQQALIFGVYGRSLEALEGGQVSDAPGLLSVVIAGQLAGLANLPVFAPSEHLKILLQAQADAAAGTKVTAAGKGSAGGKAGKAAARVYTGTFDCAKHIVREHGIRGLYKGTAAVLTRDVLCCSFGMYYGVYELIRQRILVGDPAEGTREVATMLAGGACGLISWTWCYPFDVVKSRVQAVPYGVEKVTPMMATARAVYAAGGWCGFFAGYGVMAARSIPCNAATFLGYELTISMWHDRQAG